MNSSGRAQGYALALRRFRPCAEWTPYLDQFLLPELEVPRLRLKQDWALPPLPRARNGLEKVETIATLRALERAEWPCSRVISSPFPSLLAPNLCPSGPAPFCNCLVFWNTRRRIFRPCSHCRRPRRSRSLLRAAGAVAGPPVRNLTLPDAIARLGLKALKSWLQLMLLADAGTFSEVKLRWALERACLAAALGPQEG